MNDRELVKWARACASVDGSCDGCLFEEKSPSLYYSCVGVLVEALAGRVETLADRCARYAEEIAVMQARERWISVTEALPENGDCVLCQCADGRERVLRYDCGARLWALSVSGRHAYSFPREAVTHWRPLPEAPKEVK